MNRVIRFASSVFRFGERARAPLSSLAAVIPAPSSLYAAISPGSLFSHVPNQNTFVNPARWGAGADRYLSRGRHICGCLWGRREECIGRRFRSDVDCGRLHWKSAADSRAVINVISLTTGIGERISRPSALPFANTQVSSGEIRNGSFIRASRHIIYGASEPRDLSLSRVIKGISRVTLKHVLARARAPERRETLTVGG